MKSYQAVATATGTGPASIAEARLSPPSGYYWFVDHIAVQTSLDTSCIARVYVDQKYFCGTKVGEGDTADGAPLPVNDNQTLRCVWTGPGAAAICTMNILVDEAIRGTQ